jgi:hypothetical protein
VGLGVAAALLGASPAEAFLGFGEKSGEEIYTERTVRGAAQLCQLPVIRICCAFLM